jgi:hypothetical protein
MATTHLATVFSGSNVVGGSIAIFASIIGNLGANLQKHSHNKDAKKTVAERRPYLLRGVWWIGFAGVVFGAIGDFSALAFGSQSLVSAMGGGTTLICNVLAANYFNEEKFYRTDIYGVVAVIAGAVTFAITTPSQPRLNIDELKQSFLHVNFIIYATCVLVTVAVLLSTIASNFFYRWRARFTEAMLRPVVLKVEAALRSQSGRIDVLEARLAQLSSEDGSPRARRPGATPCSSRSSESFGEAGTNLTYVELQGRTTPSLSELGSVGDMARLLRDFNDEDDADSGDGEGAGDARAYIFNTSKIVFPLCVDGQSSFMPFFISFHAFLHFIFPSAQKGDIFSFLHICLA